MEAGFPNNTTQPHFLVRCGGIKLTREKHKEPPPPRLVSDGQLPVDASENAPFRNVWLAPTVAQVVVVVVVVVVAPANMSFPIFRRKSQKVYAHKALKSVECVAFRTWRIRPQGFHLAGPGSANECGN